MRYRPFIKVRGKRKTRVLRADVQAARAAAARRGSKRLRSRQDERWAGAGHSQGHTRDRHRKGSVLSLLHFGSVNTALGMAGGAQDIHTGMGKTGHEPSPRMKPRELSEILDS